MRVLPRDPSDSGLFGMRSSGEQVRLLSSDNVLSDERPSLETWLASESEPAMAVAWSGGLGEGLFARDPMTWLAPGRSALGLCCDALAPRLVAANRTLVIRPHCRHVVSDPTAAAAFYAERAGGPFALALDPVALFETDMLWRWEDHLTRAFETLGPLARVVVLGSPNRPETADSLPSPLPVGEGLFDAGTLVRLVREHCRGDCLVLFPVGDPSAQASLLGLL